MVSACEGVVEMGSLGGIKLVGCWTNRACQAIRGPGWRAPCMSCSELGGGGGGMMLSCGHPRRLRETCRGRGKAKKKGR